jgi:hypothetical protein
VRTKPVVRRRVNAVGICMMSAWLEV